MDYRTASTDVQDDWDGLFPAQFAANRTVFIHKSSDVDSNGFIERSTDSLRPLTLLL